ncbi:MAG: hypothetical protein WBV82_09575 [Myxococcaceae bacterium]
MYLRSLSMLLLVGWQAVGGGLFGMLHECKMRAEAQAEARECYCPHKKADPSDWTGATLEVDCCESHELLGGTPAAVVDSQRFISAVAAPVELAYWNLAPADEGALSALHLRDVQFAQGPPLFLKIRTLLI